ncbi:MAG: 1-deoxy-D-xylulose-5-phosphate reductoisomerase [Candidatus Marinimicrobia bacterium]|nr:1-deoxy-D-xylulose-5-phosphate reductoisomerase [Candidatus Neomarinimicrobiota bacterium]MBL7023389.1 1-deoxy-D-xylulose-5-phosphate reductoisomerase [Candidatus Neomarinimicrobiota bacterium]MBL7109730.1 1-deoxy-D-xylulose-5-phosphate reductoisomerase [Candidatus Neomarinimicrobiota bacterium]
MKKIGILGSTGSIGTQTLEVVRRQPTDFSVEYLSSNRNVKLLAEQAIQTGASIVCIADESYKEELQNLLNGNSVEIIAGRKALIELAGNNSIDLMVNGLVGAPGMEPTISAIRNGIDVALSNKESLVMAGELINSLLEKHNVKLYPIDSEHSAIWQCLIGEKVSQIHRLILTGSGGPFRTKPVEQFSRITKADALNHPNWDMGAKITIDSATMMNKGLEVIEARWLFDMPPNKIDIVVHPQSIIHSMVEFYDGSVKAQLGLPSMKIPIQYALNYPNHTGTKWDNLDLTKIGNLTFEKPDLPKFKCIKLAYDALQLGDSYPIVLNVANDTVVQAFLDEKVSFTDIPNFIESAMDTHKVIKKPDLEDIEDLTDWTQQFTQNLIRKKNI